MADSTPCGRAVWARRYVEKLGMSLVAIPPGQKAPRTPGWQQPENQLAKPDMAQAFWEQYSDHNIGVVLGTSGLCSLDVDDVPATRQVLAELLGLDLDEMIAAYPTVVGNPERCRLLFRVPPGVELSRHALSWPNREEAGSFTVVEFRAGAVQDVLPPSIHPGTGNPYVWRTPPQEGWVPLLPDEILAAWVNWDVFKRDALSVCPWAKSEASPRPHRPERPASDGESVINAFNRTHDIEQVLAAHGYVKRGRRWMYPHSSTKLPGISIIDGAAFSHHASDPLNNGHMVDPFDAFCLLQHGGDQRQAVRDAARMLGMEHRKRELPPLPEEAPPPAAPDNGGEGGGDPEWSAEMIHRRFALLDGEKKVFDLHRRRILKWAAFEALVTRALAKAWLDTTEKKVIDAEQAKRQTDDAKLAAKLKGEAGKVGMVPMERYVFLDGTQDIWDCQLRMRLPKGAVQLALGDAFSLWVNSPDRKQIPHDRLVFDPRMTKDPAEYINTFEGLPLTPVDAPESCRSIVYLIHWLCNGDKAAMHWLTCWLAYPLQNVGAKLDTAVLAHSTMEGSGKSLLMSDIMGEIYGKYGATVGQVQLESSWSQWQENKLYGVFEEVVSRDQRYNQVGKIKHMITGKTMRIEAKFVSGWEQTNYMNAAFLSNEVMPWPISENDRRMLVIWPNETLPKDATQALKRELDGEGVSAFYHYLLNYDVGDFDERTRPPMTRARQRLVEMSRAAWQNFLAAWRSGLLGVPYGVARTQDVHDLFLEWCSKNREHTMSETKFSLLMSSEIPKSDQQMGWYDMDERRVRSMFYLPDPPVDVDLGDGRKLGALVKRFRDAALEAGWNPLGWDKCRGWVKPYGGNAANDAA
ncbi:bifunctional DNA primase/polymerase [Salinicola sp. JS01]|uniref:bifunctional DNA primase/polymerase n=1 Tax=Salinicola sp. JS01 TaxID=3050071 RepID=UPI00255BBA3E|nr:bifunctional DNA primase/polymerase [Salinicola sp. JS01]WIX34130.1 bifunctional DNA primase/polymerase [Salinicola sp. JS01]